jgi:hypothetical protein
MDTVFALDVPLHCPKLRVVRNWFHVAEHARE